MVAAAVVAVFGLAVFLALLPDIKRYRKIRSP
jgi:hypothetical protein